MTADLLFLLEAMKCNSNVNIDKKALVIGQVV